MIKTSEFWLHFKNTNETSYFGLPRLLYYCNKIRKRAEYLLLGKEGCFRKAYAKRFVFSSRSNHRLIEYEVEDTE